jgi:hypothetical protein
VEDHAHPGRTTLTVDPRELRWLEEVAAAARELPAENQSQRLRTALTALVEFQPPPEALVGPPDPYAIGRSICSG